MRILRSLTSVVVGIAAFSLALLGASALGQALLGREPEWINRSVSTQLLWLACNVASMTAAGYVTASIAPRARVAHAVIMAAIQSTVTFVAMLTVTDTITPQWLWIAGLVATVPSAWAGATLRYRGTATSHTLSAPATR